MKLDKSTYYPKSNLDDEEELVEEVEMETTESIPTTRPGTAEPEPDDRNADGPDLPPTETEAAITGVSHLLSWVLVPLLMPVYGVILAFTLTLLSFTGLGTRIVFTAIVAGMNVAIPALVVLLLKRIGIVQDLGLNGQKERFIPYVCGIMCLLGTALFMHVKGAPIWLVMFFIGGAAAGIIEVVVNRWWKISVHAAGIAGIVALLVHILMGDYCAASTQGWLIAAIILAGLLGSARIWLGRHTLGQVLAGYAVGFCSVFLFMSIS